MKLHIMADIGWLLNTASRVEFFLVLYRFTYLKCYAIKLCILLIVHPIII